LGAAPAGFEIPVAQPISGLTPNTTYHYRLVATSPGGTAAAADVTFTTRSVDPVAPDGLPDGRAYEQVSPAEKGGNVMANNQPTSIASTTGNAMTFTSLAGFAGTVGSGLNGNTQYASFRGEDGWHTRGITPAPSPSAIQVFGGNLVFPFSDDIESSIVKGADLLVPTDDSSLYNLYYENNRTGALQTIVTPGTTPGKGLVQPPVSATGDLGQLLVQTTDNLTPDASGTRSKLYEWDHGVMRIAGLLPGDVLPPLGAAAAGPPDAGTPNQSAISRDGTRIIFASPQGQFAAGRQLYVRKNATTTVQVSESEATTPDTPHRAVFQAAAPDGRSVVFSTDERLLDEDSNDGVDVYLWRDSDDPASDANLTLVSQEGSSSFDGESIVAGMSDDAEYIYYASYGESLDGEPAGGEKLYVWHNGERRYIATLDPSFDRKVRSAGREGDSRVSSDGRMLAFLSFGPQPTVNGQSGHAQMYAYDYASDSLTCVSCPSSSSPTSDVTYHAAATFEGQSIALAHRIRFMTSDGRRIFFSTADPLVTRDVNGLYDAYEYDVESGVVALLSTGRDRYPAFFIDSSSSGDDAFIATANRLVGWDRDGLIDMYDARVGGGFPEPTPAELACVADDCQGSHTTPPLVRRPSTSTGAGEGDARPTTRSVFSVSNLSRAQIVRLSRTGKVSLAVRTSRPGVVSVRARARISRRSQTIAIARARSRRAGVVTLHLRLSRAAVRELAQTRHLTIRLTVGVTGARGRKTLTARLKARRPVATSRTLDRR
jgi:hypothetical protein